MNKWAHECVWLQGMNNQAVAWKLAIYLFHVREVKNPRSGVAVHCASFSWLLTLLLWDGCYPSCYDARIEDKKKRQGEQRERLFFPWRLCHLVQEGKTSLAHMVMPSGKRSWEIKCLACLEHSLWEGSWNCVLSKPAHSIIVRLKWSNVYKIPTHSNHWRNNSLLLLWKVL